MVNTDSQANGPAQPDAISVSKHRSPNYPVYRIGTALEKTKILYDAYKRHPVPISAAAVKLGFKAASSATGQAVAALKAYGLIDVQGSGDNRQITVTEEGAKISGNHVDRLLLIRDAALKPKLHAELYKRFFTADGLAPDETIRHYLIWDRSEGKFNEDAVEPFIRQFKSTLDYSGVKAGQTVIDGSEDDSGSIASDTSIAGSAATAPTATKQSSTLPKPDAEHHYRPPAIQEGMKPEVFALSRGAIYVQWPEAIQQSDIEDIEAWLPILLRKIKKSVSMVNVGTAEGPD